MQPFSPAQPDYPDPHRRARRAWVAAFVVTIAFGAFIQHAITHNLFETLYAWTRSQEAWQLDEFFSAALIGTVVLAVALAWSWRNLRRENAARRVSEAALRQSAESFTDMFDAAGEGLVIREGETILAANQTYAALVGRSVEEIVGGNVRGLFAPASRELAWEQARLRSDLPFEATIISTGGRTIPVEVIGRSIRYQGRPARLVALRDITARRVAEEALRASEASLAEAQRLAHLGNWEVTLATGALYWSDEIYRIGGYAPQSFAPTPERVLAIVHPADRELVRSALQTLADAGTPYDLIHRVVRPDGAVRTVHQQAELIRDAAGRPVKRVGIVQDVTERREMEEQLQRQAFHDALTDLPNRALFFDRLGQALARVRSGEQPCAVLFLDLDHFKDINDTRGHDVGDQLLVAVAERLRGTLRATDTLARLGGDEFTLLLETVKDAGEAVAAAERIAATLATPFRLGGHEERVTASIGIVLSTAGHDRPEDLLRDADVAMYRAKATGRVGYALFNPAMQAALTERLALERDLRGAIEQGEFVMHYQPQVDLATGRIVALEALVRWPHPTRGLVLPNVFIPLAEETGLIVPIGRWVLGAACRHLTAWQARYPGIAPLTVAVNLSARQFGSPDLAEAVAAVLAATGLAAAHLTLEVTETVAMEHPETSIATLATLKALGVHLAIDDFGTGYSSLAYLQDLPVDTLKIDRSFFRESAPNRAIVGAVLNLAHGLGLNVVAEGLETATQVAWARESGCDWGQGYYFARPLPAADLEALWATTLAFDLPAAASATDQATPERRTSRTNRPAHRDLTHQPGLLPLPPS